MYFGFQQLNKQAMGRKASEYTLSSEQCESYQHNEVSSWRLRLLNNVFYDGVYKAQRGNSKRQALKHGKQCNKQTTHSTVLNWDKCSSLSHGIVQNWILCWALPFIFLGKLKCFAQGFACIRMIFGDSACDLSAISTLTLKMKSLYSFDISDWGRERRNMNWWR